MMGKEDAAELIVFALGRPGYFRVFETALRSTSEASRS